MYLTQGLHRAAQIRGDATATVFGPRRRSWREHLDRVARYAAGLKALGLERGDRVAIIAHNSDLYIETFNAVAWAGGVAVPGNFRWSEREHIHALKDSGARLLILDRTYERLAPALMAELDFAAVLLMDAGDEPSAFGHARTEDLIASNAPMADACGRDDDLCFILYTGGTTGQSKGVMLSHRSLISGCLAVSATTPAPPDQVFLHSAPMFHLAGATTVLAVTMGAGAHIVIETFTPAAAIEAIERERVTSALVIPTMFGMLRDHLAAHPADLTSVRRIRYGASAISETLLREAMAMFPNAEFQQGYGQTELSSSVTILEPRFHTANGAKSYLRSAGRAVMGADIRIVDEDLTERPLGQVGEILVRGPGVMLGYWNLPELTAATVVEGWVRTGDAGYMDEEGFLYIADRLKDMIVSGGENVFSAEVENALNAHAAVAECAVVGAPDAKWGERVHAIVRFKAGASASLEDLAAHCKTLIAGYKSPRSLEVRTEPLPTSAQGKILKHELQKAYWEGCVRLVG